jgi:carbonic anhydrase
MRNPSSIRVSIPSGECGAVRAAIRAVQENIELPSAIDLVADSIRPVVLDVANLAGDLVANSVAANVRHGVKLLTASTPLVNEPLSVGRLRVTGATCDLTMDKVLLLRS